MADRDLFGEVPKQEKRGPGRPRKNTARATAKKKAAKKKTAKKKAAKKKAKKKASKKAAPEVVKPVQPGGEVVPFDAGVCLSISQLSEETGSTRETISKRLRAARVPAAGKRRGYAIYRLRDALQALFESSDGGLDPEKMDPFKRRAYYQGENDRLSLQERAGELVPAMDVEQEIGRILKIATQGLETLPDIVERDVGAPPAVIARMVDLIDDVRKDMHAQLIDDADRTVSKAGD